jgi:phage terminase small subunit
MPKLENVGHEKFAQELAKGLGISAAYTAAGFKNSPASATRLSKKVKNRVEEITSTTTAMAISALAISKERVLDELAAIAFLDIREIVRWESQLIEEDVNDDGGKVRVNKEIRTNTVLLVSSDKLPEHVARAVCEIKQGAKGGVSIKTSNKLNALEKIGRYLGMWNDDKPTDPGTQNIANVLVRLETMTEVEKMRRIGTWLREAAQKSKLEREKNGTQEHWEEMSKAGIFGIGV